MKRLTQKQETFCIKYFELGNGTEAAVIAGYSRKTAEVVASQNLRKLNVMERIKQLRQTVEDKTVTSVLERKQILAEIARGRLTDFMECGQDGSWINIDAEKMNTHAIQAIDTKTEYDQNGAEPTVVTKIRLHNPIQAIAELNKMEGIYEAGNVTNINNRIINIKVVYDGSNGTRVCRSLAETPR